MQTPVAEWMSRKVAAAYVGRSPKTIDHWARLGLLTPSRPTPNSRPLYSRRELDAILEAGRESRS